MINVVVERLPIILAGLPARSWAFALRIWLAIVVALYVSFWLELEAPSTAALTVCILALPTRGQGLEKAGFRLVATAIGVSVSIAIVGTFIQTESLILAVFAVWLGVCVYVAGLLDGNRAYAAALCCTTVALIAVWQLNTPQNVFAAGMARGSAIVVGVLAVALVNEALAAPDYYSALTVKLKSIQARLKDCAEAVVRGKMSTPDLTADLLRELAALRPEVTSLATELSSGRVRCAAARAAIVDLVAVVFAVRSLQALASLTGPAGGDIHSDQEAETDRPYPSHVYEQATTSPNLFVGCREWLMEELTRTDGLAQGSLDAFYSEKLPPRERRAPIYRSRRIAAESAIRAAVHFALISAFFVVAGWPTANICLTFVAIIIALGSTTPDPRKLTAAAIVVAPLACTLVGILTFLVLDGVSDFPLLAIALAPFVIGPALLMTLPNPTLSGVGRLTLVFTIIVFAPSNPPTYDPQSFLFTSLFLCLAAVLSFAVQLLVPPLSSDRRLRLLLVEFHRDLGIIDGADDRLEPDEILFRDAVRIGQIATMAGAATQGRRAMQDAIVCFDRASTLHLCFSQLERLRGGSYAEAAATARRSIDLRDGAAMHASAAALCEAASQHAALVKPTCAALVLAGLAWSIPQPTAHIAEIESR